MKSRKTSFFLCLGLLLPGAMPLQADNMDFPDITREGLHRVPDSKLAVVYTNPGADLTPYRRVRLLDATVAFKKNWEKNQRHNSTTPLQLSSRDVERMKTRLAEEFHDVFSEVFESGGYPVVDQAAEDVLLIRPAIINLDAAVPDKWAAGRAITYVKSAGEMTLYVEVYDSVSGGLIAQAMDRKVDVRNAGMYSWANSVTNSTAAERMLKDWASTLLDALNDARQESGS